ncbi:MAG: cyclic peptide export ABC transporter [Candidatus Thiodiazotropha sp.]
MELIKFLLNHSKYLLSIAVVAGVFNGIIVTVLLKNINDAVTGSVPFAPMQYFLLIVFSVVSYLTTAFLINKLSEQGMYSLRRDISSIILKAELQALEIHGESRLFTSLTEDINSLVSAMSLIPGVIIESSILLACIGYLGWLSLEIMLITLLTILLGLAGYSIILRPAQKNFTVSREWHEKLVKLFHGIIFGNKELKQNINKRNIINNIDLINTLEIIKTSNLKAEFMFTVIDAWGRMLLFLLLGIVVYISQSKFILSDITPAIIVSSVSILIFCLTPLATLVSILPILSKAIIGYRKIKMIKFDYERITNIQQNNDCKEIELKNVTFTYPSENGDQQFQVGPINLKLHRGQITFFVGGNGSGKTTLAKLVSGLYTASQGEILCDGKKVDNKEIDNYRQNFSAIWSNYYLFDRVLINNNSEDKDKFYEWLIRMDLQNKIQLLDDGKIETEKLSTGQRKRLALIPTLIEDRKFIVLDEWPAEQAPEFKDYFYSVILNELKNKGVGVLIITHDNKYYDIADQIFYMDNGLQIQIDQQEYADRKILIND